ncbi:hypothetical protein VF14_18330 [Nostoc linckia z18]|uniref:Uncharacterized protein n=2 Tax=Nostoc linckia TaxID=92942 RepID=A0A9Q5Z984_NOSLI|nr:hypothetical protein [Nostoc linckia]PHJ53459.1 hypothetical protein VF02_37215 [Nostoc linckia z1]PHJ81973.1 hypothetical protein VF07_29200 [Nostoc linckia z6]PHJ92871.1 hypothetical protein VF04_27915 [Nostoc linckia z7]PHK00806.1 hypothetical protein VF08_23330 [Nostoc linckia z8]PHK09316.1 hypothetical protein VF09_15975 [Nostoc linckia z9]
MTKTPRKPYADEKQTQEAESLRQKFYQERLAELEREFAARPHPKLKDVSRELKPLVMRDE